MLYSLFEYLQSFDIPGTGLFRYISFRAGMAATLSLLITIIFGDRLILLLKKWNMKESIRDLGLENQLKKEGTPTMGGVIILSAIVLPTLLFADLTNIYVLLLLMASLWMGSVGFLDDFLKIKKKNKEGLRAKFKILGQISLGLIVGLILVFHNDASVELTSNGNLQQVGNIITTIPFVKNNEFDYSWLLPEALGQYTWVVYVWVVIFIIISISNGVNLTDGLDGLATGVCAIIGLTLAVLAYLSGNSIFANYLNIIFIPNSGELAIFCSAFVGSCVGFLWYNTHPAQIFMGDTGSLSLGSIIAVLALVIRKELLIPILCGVFVIENLSVVIQVTYFKYTRRKYGKGKRIFLKAPLHHHYEEKGIKEPKIVGRFWIISILLAILTLATLKIR